MSNTTQLTPAQHTILTRAADHPEGKIEWFPDNIKGGARKKVLDGLFNRALITPLGADWFVAAEGYDALGRARPGAAGQTPAPQDEADTAPVEASDAPAQAPTDNEPTPEESPEEVPKQTPETAPQTSPEPEGASEDETTKKAPRIRDNTKQATVIAMLRRPEGATIAQIMAATDWQAHTVRGTLAGALKKKLGLNVVSEKAEGGERVYCIKD